MSKLSTFYTGWTLWAMVYHTQPGSSEVELFEPIRFFKTKEKAVRWFNKKFYAEDFVEPEAVEFSGFSHLTIKD
jgi:hypothetical protein